MRKNKVFLAVFMIMAIATIGCASKQPTAPKTDPAISQLNQTASDIKADLKKLAKIRQSQFETVELYEAPQKGPLTKALTLKWAGPIDDVLEIIALTIDYKFKVKGEAPVAPVLVHVDETQTPAFAVLEDLGWKAGKHEVSVDAGKKIVQLTYFERSFTDRANAEDESER